MLLLPVQTVQDALSQVLLVGEVGVVECDALLREGQAGGAPVCFPRHTVEIALPLQALQNAGEGTLGQVEGFRIGT